MSTTAFANLVLDQGGDWSRTFTWQTGDPANGVPVTPVDLTGVTAVFSVRPTQSVLSTPVITETPTLGGVLGTMVVSIPAATDDGVPSGQYYWDLIVTFPNASVFKFMCGGFLIR
jgi:hypothetical protein